jgi:hypothetical protein
MTAVRRPRRSRPKATLVTLKKAELVELAESEGVDTSGTKADIVERLSDE